MGTGHPAGGYRSEAVTGVSAYVEPADRHPRHHAADERVEWRTR